MGHTKVSKVYIAASSADIERAELWSSRLSIAGIEVVSTWMQTVRDVGDANPRAAERADRQRWAVEDLTQVRSCDLLWMLVPSTARATRGAWLECGFAEALNKIVVFSGDTAQSVFCALGDEWQGDEEAFALICRLSRTGSYRADRWA